jgi:hypothetical protein
MRLLREASGPNELVVVMKDIDVFHTKHFTKTLQRDIVD